MEIILLKSIEKVGKKFDVVKVKDGYGRNYLIPQGLAIVANKDNQSKLDSFKRQETAKLSKMLNHYKEIASQLRGKTITVIAKTGTSGRIFGSITATAIAKAMQEQLGIEVDRRAIEVPDHVKMLGTYTAILDLHPDIDTGVDFEVVGENGQRAAAATKSHEEVTSSAAASQEEE